MVCKRKILRVTGALFNTKMYPQTVPKPMALEEPNDFGGAVRVARRVFKWNDSELAFAASSDASRVLFVEWAKREIRGGVV